MIASNARFAGLAVLALLFLSIGSRSLQAAGNDPDFRYQMIQSLGYLGDQVVDRTPRLGALLYRYEGFLAQRLLDSGVVNESQFRLLSESFVDAAIGLAILGHRGPAMQSIEKAVALGFEDRERIFGNEHLAQVPGISRVSLSPMVRPAPAETAMFRWARESVKRFRPFPFTFDVENSAGGNLKPEYFEGKVVLVDIWATWCGPCRASIPQLVRLQEEFGERGFQVVGLSVDNLQQPGQARDKVNQMLKSLNANYPSGLAGPEIPAQIKGDQSIPMLIFLDGGGQVRFALNGSHGYEELAAIAEFLLHEESGAGPH